MSGWGTAPEEEHTTPADTRLAAVDWLRVGRDLDAQGWALLPGLLSAEQCMAIAGLYDYDRHFRDRVVLARHGFGRGEYKYFAYPLPPLLLALRGALYRELAPIANRWHEALGATPRPLEPRAESPAPVFGSRAESPAPLSKSRAESPARFAPSHAEFLARCHAAGQTRPTPLLLRYGADDFNCLHQDLYGEHVFPLQVAALLSEPGRDFVGGEFVLTEQRPRMQSRVEVVPLECGDAVVFAVRERPVRGTRGVYRVQLRHGVSRVRSGRRHTVGLIFHDAT